MSVDVVTVSFADAGSLPAISTMKVAQFSSWVSLEPTSTWVSCGSVSPFPNLLSGPFFDYSYAGGTVCDYENRRMGTAAYHRFDQNEQIYKKYFLYVDYSGTPGFLHLNVEKRHRKIPNRRLVAVPEFSR